MQQTLQMYNTLGNEKGQTNICATNEKENRVKNIAR